MILARIWKGSSVAAVTLTSPTSSVNNFVHSLHKMGANDEADKCFNVVFSFGD